MKRIEPLLVVLIAAPLSLLSGCTTPDRFENECSVFFSHPVSAAAIPTGMRRTKYGWEDASLWTVAPGVPPSAVPSRSIDQWVAQQRQREPGWVRAVILEIRETPPLMVAVLQLAAIAAILRLGRLVEPQAGASPRG
jgi:hypothetical protein